MCSTTLQLIFTLYFQLWIRHGLHDRISHNCLVACLCKSYAKWNRCAHITFTAFAIGNGPRRNTIPASESTVFRLGASVWVSLLTFSIPTDIHDYCFVRLFADNWITHFRKQPKRLFEISNFLDDSFELKVSSLILFWPLIWRSLEYWCAVYQTSAAKGLRVL